MKDIYRVLWAEKKGAEISGSMLAVSTSIELAISNVCMALPKGADIVSAERVFISKSEEKDFLRIVVPMYDERGAL